MSDHDLRVTAMAKVHGGTPLAPTEQMLLMSSRIELPSNAEVLSVSVMHMQLNHGQGKWERVSYPKNSPVFTVPPEIWWEWRTSRPPPLQLFGSEVVDDDGRC